ncbi:hypothetical protein [Bosea sp. 685]|uniref:hypothetical protein n=1 Tax=Bosea sp. 685 TaxID=3080057 RepID=UPI002892C31A|nr:hypothetical protein [Bosea sp. 685]WNJ90880.1 hypothetical protein RMR04_31785 [Bosea sp. 685]
MKPLTLLVLLTLACTSAHAQTPGPTIKRELAAESWNNNLPAPDDRYTNPKSKLYNGPNGWFGTGRVVAEIANPSRTRYDYKASFVSTNQTFVGVEAGKLTIMTMDFGIERPAAGDYKAGSKAAPSAKAVKVTFDDLTDKKIRGWASADNAGIVTVSEINGFLYFKLRDLRLQPVGPYNTGDMKAVMTIGFEGAIPPGR